METLVKSEAAEKAIIARDRNIKQLFGVVPGSRAHRPGETVPEFTTRIVDELPEILILCEGDCDIAATVFDIESALVGDFVASDSGLAAAHRDGLSIAVEKEKRGRDAGIALKEKLLANLMEEDSRITRSKWPRDRDDRIKALMGVMPQAIDDYYGNEQKIASALNVHISEVKLAIASDEDLLMRLEHAQSSAICEVEDHLFELAKQSNSPTAAMFYLKNKDPERWSDKQVHDVRTGFAPPPADQAPPTSVLFKTKETEE